MDKERLEQIRSNTKELDDNVYGGTEYYLRNDAERSVTDLKDLIAEVDRLQAKIKSGVECAHDMQKAWWDGKHLVDDHYESAQDDAAWDILEAMEEPQYHRHLTKEANDN